MEPACFGNRVMGPDGEEAALAGPDQGWPAGERPALCRVGGLMKPAARFPLFLRMFFMKMHVLLTQM
ncbi:MAG: hypothetical protein D6694_13530 [Gammaproteobacteria bacterium]|nr:MAG: hypothetical protein D6694_13530 [Gammaproteobacteria bacterium]